MENGAGLQVGLLGQLPDLRVWVGRGERGGYVGGWGLAATWCRNTKRSSWAVGSVRLSTRIS